MTTPETEEYMEIQRVLTLIRRVDLVYPDEELLECFLQDSVDPLQTARYIFRRCFAAGDGGSSDLTDLLADWKRLIANFLSDIPVPQPLSKAITSAIFERDGGKCCISGLTNSFLDPLVVVPLLSSPTLHLDKELHEILGIFIGAELLDWRFSKAANLNIFQSHWLVRRSAAAALSQGFYRFDCEGKGLNYSVSTNIQGDPTCPSIVKQAPLIRRGRFSDQSDFHVDNPDRSALQFLSRVSRPIRWTLVAQEIARKRPQIQPVRDCWYASLWRCSVERSVTVMSMAWRLLPAFVRIRAYHGLAFLGRRIYGSSGSFSVQRLPFGMYLKIKSMADHGKLENEYAAMQLVRRHTVVPVPSALDLVSDSNQSCLLMSRVPGDLLGACIHTLSHSEETALVCDLQKALSQLRAIPKQVAPDYAITNTLGKACSDGRIYMYSEYVAEQGKFAGPFVDEAAFHDRLRIGALPDFSNRNGHRIVFTHGDLNMRNVMMYNGRFSGFVDWETAGWFPEYWEYTKVHFVTRRTRRWLRIVDKVFEPFGDFETELEIEREFWDYLF